MFNVEYSQWDFWPPNITSTPIDQRRLSLPECSRSDENEYLWDIELTECRGSVAQLCAYRVYPDSFTKTLFILKCKGLRSTVACSMLLHWCTVDSATDYCRPPMCAIHRYLTVYSITVYHLLCKARTHRAASLLGSCTWRAWTRDRQPRATLGKGVSCWTFVYNLSDSHPLPPLLDLTPTLYYLPSEYHAVRFCTV